MVSTEGNKVQRTIMRLFFISPLKLLYYNVLYLTYWYKCVSSKCVKRLANYWIIWLLLFHAKILHSLYCIVHPPNRMWLRNSGFYVSEISWGSMQINWKKKLKLSRLVMSPISSFYNGSSTTLYLSKYSYEII